MGWLAANCGSDFATISPSLNIFFLSAYLAQLARRWSKGWRSECERFRRHNLAFTLLKSSS
jgi:hypothetical protein